MATKQTFFALKDIRPNPYRDFKRNPLLEGKLLALRASIQDTGFWDNVLARIGSDGKPQLAYGHHRYQAALDVYGPDTKVGILICDLSDAEMIQIMARENDDEYGTYAFASLLESIRAAVSAYAEGKIQQEQIGVVLGGKGNKSQVRYAPSFVPGFRSDSEQNTYTVDSIARFLGLTKKRGNDFQARETVLLAINALSLLELGAMTEAQLKGLNFHQAEKKVSEGITAWKVAQVELKRQELEAEQAKERADRYRREQEELKKRQAEELEHRRKADEEFAKKAREEEVARRAKESIKLREKQSEVLKKAQERAKLAENQAEQKKQDVQTLRKNSLEDVREKIREAGKEKAKEPASATALSPWSVSKTARTLTERVNLLLTENDTSLYFLTTQLVKGKKSAPENELDATVSALRGLAERLHKYADKLESK